jgi:flagellar basal-body rod protein FlgB
MTIFGKSLNGIENALNVATLQQRTISSNIANADTPNYKSKKVSFQTQLNEAVNKHTQIHSNRTNENHIEFSTETTRYSNVKIEENSQTTFNNNGNNVDMDHEMAQLAQNQLWYNFLVENMNSKFTGLRTVIKGGS